MGGVDHSERRSCTLGGARDANVASIRSTYEDARDEAVRYLLHREARSAAAVGQNDGIRFIRGRDTPGERKPGTVAWKPGDSEEDDKSMGSKEDEPRDGDRTAG